MDFVPCQSLVLWVDAARAQVYLRLHVQEEIRGGLRGLRARLERGHWI
jgi:hypothetical protein